MFPNHFYDPAAYQAWSQAAQGGEGSSSYQQEETPPSSPSARDNSAQFSKQRSGPAIQQKLINEFKKLPVTPQPYHWHNSGHHSSHSHNHETADTSSIRDETANTSSIRVGGHTIQHVKGGKDRNGGVVTCIAMVANISYEKARSAAIEIADFEPGGDGLYYKQAKDILEKFGVKSRRHVYKKINWSDLPDIALVSVLDPRGEAHAVVFVRSNKGEFIFDGNKHGPVSRDGYKIDPEDAYLEILGPEHNSGHHGSNSHHPVSHQPYPWHNSGHDSHYSHHPVSHQPYPWHNSGHDSHYSHYPVSHQPYPWHNSGYYGNYSYNHETANTSSIRVGGRTIQHVKAGGGGKGCTVTCIAMIANISYQRARDLTIDMINWDRSTGVAVRDAKKILKRLGIETNLYKQDRNTSWSDYPDLALIVVEGRKVPHAVVFVRTKDGRELIFDCKKRGSVSRHGYAIEVGNYYLEIL